MLDGTEVEVTNDPLHSVHIEYGWGQVIETLISRMAPECPCSDCREAREISSMDKLYPDGRITLNNAE